MDDDLDLSFTALAPSVGIDTLAYWLGPCNVAAVHGIDATGIAQAMSYQYEIEEQADRSGMVMPEDVDWREHYTPVAPVQLTRAWSPLPYAIHLLGPADWLSIGEPDLLGARAAACAWSAPRVDHPMPAPQNRPDQRRFHRLLAVAVMRANDSGRGMLVVAKPGWSYVDDHISAAAARLMRAAGFAFQDRHS